MSVGLLGYHPNAEGVDWFLHDIWPKVVEKHPELSYAIAGAGAPKDKADAWANMKNVKVLGFVEDLDPLYEKSMAVVAPILSGAGTCIKVVEAALRGRKIFATPTAIRGNEGIFGAETFRDAKDFMKLLEKWLELPAQIRFTEERKISACAKREYSFERFNLEVERLLY